ncbi:retrovirus-related Pol polyprotein from transposon opus [Trichonephila inaurata madagascariensis]|uniref:Retrovirus-related Pol polyprotein from transposon opus n=1 Tax=Trichonephila inaurata madagascariensis TaxID=2747483 RepID=A0A8X6KNK9_9ARAC|nr:retrovirus-related Pol polyprotein from transposon opus [Trichonephila inaurata madagascariensis]
MRFKLAVSGKKKLNRTSEADEKKKMKLEENLAEDIENLLPSFMEEKDTMSLININTDEFIKAQQKSEELVPLIQKVEKGMNNEASDYSLTKGKHLIKSRKNKNGDIRQLLVIPEKFRSSILKMGHEGKTHLVEHDIELINDVPIRTKPYRMSARQTDLLQEEIKKMLKYQVIEIGESDYASPMILVETPGRDPRPCIDYRKLNEVIRTQFYPLPNIEHRIETVAAAKYITLLDLTKGYWQIPLTPKAQRLAAFTTKFGTYRPLRMPFGLKNAPYYFSRLMAELLQGCEKFALPYLDDVAIFSENWDEHISHIDKVL